ncbi:PREDICTED: allene oxide synthase 3-like [Nicotiana attenuata]|uniref:Allene oxide synthase 3 n=1 Tax=Nicotiana attenuata TaxID=49451 RepID=A0A1J6J921_NICAT|nr:PREDICTED: allene oxide synthase 3-like [Nicotiana attenuata]OIT07315.1 allene oxide synthase 3 [Nicotiana attenuata]
MSSFSTSSAISNSKLPVREIPGDYGFPFFGAIKDRYDYFYNLGIDEFFLTKIQKYNSTVFRTNMPPGPFIAKNPKVIVLLDAKTFPVLFDNSKVEKMNVLDGTYVPSTAFYGGYRPCAYLDPSESNHATLKGFFLSLISKLHNQFIPLFRSSISGLFANLENEISQNGKANFNNNSDVMSFDFVFRLLCDETNPHDTNLGSNGSKLFDIWLLPQLAPLVTLGLKFVPNFLEDLVLHTFPLPFFLVRSNYQKLYDAFSKHAGSILNEAEKNGIKRDEACHNLVFLAGFNAYGGMKVLFPTLIKWVANGGKSLHTRLANEIRTIIKEECGTITLSTINKMSLTKSVVYEVLRIEPPVPFQYGKAEEDIIIQSHDSAFLIKKGEMIFGYQPFATKDPKIFDKPEEFIPERFMAEGEKLLKYVYWSNARETDDPTVDNKQCPGKNLVVLLCRLMLVEFFMRYDTFTVETTKLFLGSSVTFKKVEKAT